MGWQFTPEEVCQAAKIRIPRQQPAIRSEHKHRRQRIHIKRLDDGNTVTLHQTTHRHTGWHEVGDHRQSFGIIIDTGGDERHPRAGRKFGGNRL